MPNAVQALLPKYLIFRKLAADCIIPQTKKIYVWMISIVALFIFRSASALTQIIYPESPEGRAEGGASNVIDCPIYRCRRISMF